jgi:hypothetical protein
VQLCCARESTPSRRGQTESTHTIATTGRILAVGWLLHDDGQKNTKVCCGGAMCVAACGRWWESARTISPNAAGHFSLVLQPENSLQCSLYIELCALFSIVTNLGVHRTRTNRTQNAPPPPPVRGVFSLIQPRSSRNVGGARFRVLFGSSPSQTRERACESHTTRHQPGLSSASPLSLSLSPLASALCGLAASSPPSPSLTKQRPLCAGAVLSGGGRRVRSPGSQPSAFASRA